MIQDKVLKEIAHYVHSFTSPSKLALDTARLCLLDTVGCGLAALKYPQPRNIIKPVVPGLNVPNGARVIGTNFVTDPVHAAFANGALIRWLDYNDCWLAEEWGHPSDNLGALLTMTDFTSNNENYGAPVWKVKDLLKFMVQAHEIQGVLALDNSLNKVGLDHVLFVKTASAAVCSKIAGLSEEQTAAVLSHCFADNGTLRAYRHAPNTMSRKSWAAGDACSRAVTLVHHVLHGEPGIPQVLGAPGWGFEAVAMHEKPLTLARDLKDYVMENVLFKARFPAEFHAQTAVEAALKARQALQEKSLKLEDVASIKILTQSAAMRIIDKSGPLHNYADRDHCIQYMVAMPLLHGDLVAEHYTDKYAQDPRVDALRAKMHCEELERYSVDYLDPEKRSIGNALELTLKDGTVLGPFEVEYPVGHKFRRPEGTKLVMEKFYRHIEEFYGKDKVPEMESLVQNVEDLDDLTVGEFVQKFTV